MKTTLEIPDPLMQRVKLLAVQRRQKLKDAVAELLELGIGAVAEAEPRRPAPRPVKLKGRRPLDIQSIEAAIRTGRD